MINGPLFAVSILLAQPAFAAEPSRIIEPNTMCGLVQNQDSWSAAMGDSDFYGMDVFERLAHLSPEALRDCFVKYLQEELDLAKDTAASSAAKVEDAKAALSRWQK